MRQARTVRVLLLPFCCEVIGRRCNVWPWCWTIPHWWVGREAAGVSVRKLALQSCQALNLLLGIHTAAAAAVVQATVGDLYLRKLMV